MAEINIAGGTFNVLVEGDETKPAVLLVNGLGTNLHMWDGQVPELLKEFRVVRYDGRGHGASAVTDGPYSIEGLAKDALAILDALEIRKAHFIGLSKGGFIVQWILCHAPERIGRAVLANTGAHIGTPDLWNSRINKIRESGLPAIADNVVERWFSKDFREAHPEVTAPVADVLKRTSIEGYTAACAALRDADFRDAVKSIKANVLVIASEYDAATPPEFGEYLARVIDGAILIKLEAGHLSNVEVPEQFNQAVMEFLTSPETAISVSPPAFAKTSRRPRPVKRTLGTPATQPTGSIKVAVKKSSTKTTLDTPVKAAPAPKAVVVPLPANKKASAKKPEASPVPIPQKPAAKPAASKTPAKTLPVSKPATSKPMAKAAVSRSAPTAAPAKKTITAKAPVQKAVAEKNPAAKTASAPGTSAKTSAKPVAPSKASAATKPAAKKTAAPALVAKSAVAPKSAPIKKAAAPATASKAAATKPTASKATAAKSAAAKPAAAKSPAPKTTAAKTTPAKAAPTKAPVKKVAPVRTAQGKPVSRPSR